MNKAVKSRLVSEQHAFTVHARGNYHHKVEATFTSKGVKIKTPFDMNAEYTDALGIETLKAQGLLMVAIAEMAKEKRSNENKSKDRTCEKS